MSRNTTFGHILHDVGLAAWFGGSLMGAVGLNGATSEVGDLNERARVASAGWARWTPVNALAIGAHLLGGWMLLQENRHRAMHQKGVTANTVVKTAATAAALGATAYARVLGERVIEAGNVPAAGGAKPHPATPSDVATAQQQLRALQWAVPALTGLLVGLGAQQSEQQRPSQIVKGVAQKAADRAKAAAKLAA